MKIHKRLVDLSSRAETSKQIVSQPRLFNIPATSFHRPIEERTPLENSLARSSWERNGRAGQAASPSDPISAIRTPTRYLNAMVKPIIAPSVLASDFGNLTAECKRVIKDGAEWLHIGPSDFTAYLDGQTGRDLDVALPRACIARVVASLKMTWNSWMFGKLMGCKLRRHFVPNITIGVPVLACGAKSVQGAYMDCHMMVSDPMRWVPDVADAGGASYTFHIEACLLNPNSKDHDPIAIIDLIHSRGMSAGVAVSPDTPSEQITDEIGAKADLLLVMTVHPGRGGQKFIDACVVKVSQLRARFPNKNIQVDGGVGPKTVKPCAEAGSNVIVAGTAVFGAPQPGAVIQELKAVVEQELTKAGLLDG